MKIKNVYLCCVMLVVMCIMASCTDRNSTFAAYVSDDSQLVMKVNALEVLTNAGIEVTDDGVKLSDALNQLVPGYLRGSLNSMIQVKGIDPRQVILAVSGINDANGLMFLDVTDHDKFVEYITTNLAFVQGKNADGLDYYTASDITIALSSDIAICTFGAEAQAMQSIKKMHDLASKTPLQSWKIDALTTQCTSKMLVNIGTLVEGLYNIADNQAPELPDSIIAPYRESTLVIESNLKDLQFNAKSFVADEHGNVMSPKQWQAPDFDKTLLAYSTPLDRIVTIGSLPRNEAWKQWMGEMLSQQMGDEAAKLAPLYQYLQGSVMLSFGYESIMALSNDEGYHFALAMQCAPGKATEAYAAWVDALKPLEAELPELRVADTGTIATIDVNDLQFYIAQRDDMLVLTSDRALPTSGNTTIPASRFGKYIAQAIVEVPARNAAITGVELPFSLTLDGHSDGKVMDLTLTMGDTDGRLIENIISFYISLWM